MAEKTGKPRYDGRANLVQNRTDLTPEQKLAIVKKGAAKSAATQRYRRELKALARDLLDAVLTEDDVASAALRARGIEETEGAAMLLAQLMKARKGDTEAARFMRDTSGQRPVDNVAVGNLEDKPFETIDLSSLTNEQLQALAYTKMQDQEDADTEE